MSVAGAILSLNGVVIMALAFVNRGNPRWQRDMRAIVILAIGQVVLGAVVSVMEAVGR